MDSSLISIIIPSYNLESYLSKTLDSVLAQSYHNIEVIIVDDGSTDGSKQIIRSYEKLDSRVHGIFKENGGVTSARLAGIHASHGDWIGFVDGDDYIEPDMYERLLKNAQKYHADISHCGYQMILPSGNIRMYHGSGKLIVQNHLDGIRDLLTSNFIEPGIWNKLYSRQIINLFLDKISMDFSIKINEDLLMNYYLFQQAHSSVFEDFCPYHYIVRKGSAANADLNPHQLLDPLKVKTIIFNDTLNIPELHQISANHLIRHLVYLATLNSKKYHDIVTPIRREARRELKDRLPSVLFEKSYSGKSKITTLWVSIWPSSYRWVHDFYSKVTGIDKIYEK